MEKIENKVNIESLRQWENCMSPTGEKLVKAVVDIERKNIVVWAFLHADEEELLLDDWSDQENLWWINLYLSKYDTEGFIEFDSMINLRPNQWNMSRSVENESVREKIMNLVYSIISE